MKQRRNRWKINFSAIGSILLLLGITLSVAMPAPAEAAVGKGIVGGAGPYKPGDTVTIQAVIPKPTNINALPVEVVFVVDASGSMATQITTAKADMKGFADWLTSYYGFVKVGVLSYGYEGSNNSNNPSIRTHFPLTTISTSSNITALKTGIDAIRTNPSGAGFSDLQAGLQAGNNTLTTGAASSKYLILFSDGMANMPRWDSTGLGLSWSGQCPITTGNTANIAGRRYTNFVGVAIGNDLNNPVPRNTDWSGSTGLSKYVPPCQDYLNTFGNKTGQSLMLALVNNFPGENSFSTSAPIDSLKQEITPVSVVMQDVINTDLFTAIPSAGSVINCANGATIAGASSTIDGTYSGRKIRSVIPYSSAVANYCVRFTARISSTAATGNHTVNSSTYSSNNWVRFYNTHNRQIASDTIALGSISIQSQPDLFAYALTLHKLSTGATSKSVFTTIEDIYTNIAIEKEADGVAIPSGVVTQFHSHAPSPVAAGTASDVGIRVVHDAFPATGWTRAPFRSYPGGLNEANYTANKSFKQATPGDYTARFNINYQHAASAIKEEDYTNNQTITKPYSVIAQPTSPTNSSITCSAATVSWTGLSANVTGYTINLTPAGGSTVSINAGRVISRRLTGLQASTAYSWNIVANTANGPSDVLLSSSFSTPACPEFTATATDTIPIEVGDTSTKVYAITMTYEPSVTTWQEQNGRITASVLDIIPGTATCSMAATATPNNAPTQISVDIPGSSTAPTQTLSNQPGTIAFDVYASPTATAGNHTVCVSLYSPDAHITDSQLMTLTVRLTDSPWIQIDGPSANPLNRTGDVHSNGSIAMPIPPAQYFFKNGLAGVVTATGTIDKPTTGVLSSLTNNRWLIPTYAARPITTPTYDSLLASVMNAGGITSIATGASFYGNVTSACAANKSGAWRITSAGNVTISSNIALTSDCDAVDQIYFVDSNLIVSRNIVDTSQTGTITFIVKGTISVAANVTQLDGVYIFGQSFLDGTRYQSDGSVVDVPLEIKGSLIGLAGNAPSSATGSFKISATASGFRRNLGSGNSSTPAERITYQPKYLVGLRALMGSSNYTWVSE
jgi:hypothetical protein